MYWPVMLASWWRGEGSLVSASSKMSTAANLFGHHLIAFIKVIGLGNVSVPALASFPRTAKERVILQSTLKQRNAARDTFKDLLSKQFERRLHIPPPYIQCGTRGAARVRG